MPVQLGIATTSFMLRGAPDAAAFLDYCHQLGAAGIQCSIRGADPEVLRSRAEKLGMWVEAMLGLPANDAAVEAFTRAVAAARAAGATVARVVMMPGRRYETFDTLESFRQFAERSWQTLTRAEPIARKHGLRLAIENHKDWRAPELVEMVRKISSEYVGVLVDTGNSIALLEDPMVVVEAYAPYAMATHIKDMAVESYRDGFLLSEVPLGEGYLDMPRILQTLSKARPGIRWALEMITRDPLQIPCLTPKYWATFPGIPASELARSLAEVRNKTGPKPLPRISGLSREQQLQVEEDNVRRCLAWAARAA